MTDALLAAAGRRLRDEARRTTWLHDPAGFARDCVNWPPGGEPTEYQVEVLSALAEHRRVAARSPHGGGKTSVAALAVLWFAATRDAAGVPWKVLTTAGAWRQLERYLWPEIHRWERALRWDALGLRPWRDGRESFDLGLRLRHGEAFAGASDNAALLEGLHADSVLLVLDEAKSIPSATWDAVEGALSGTGEAFALAISTPGDPSGRFYALCTQQPGLSDWHPIHVTLEQAVSAGRISPTWAEQRALQWGASSSVYQNRVLGEFASSDEDSVIPLEWVEQAMDRWRFWKASGAGPTGPVVVGVDVARFGTDKTAICVRQGNVLLSVERHALEDTMATTGRVVAKLRPGARAVVDVIGVGGGVADRLREQGCSVDGFNASEGSDAKDRSGELGFLNRRSEAWWGLRELLDPAYGPEVALVPDDQLLGDLCAPKWSVTSAGKIQIEAKDAIRKRLGRSPDAGDAVVMAFAERRSLAATYIAALSDPNPQMTFTPEQAFMAQLRGLQLVTPPTGARE